MTDPTTRARVIDELVQRIAAQGVDLDLASLERLVRLRYESLAAQARFDTYLPVLVESRVRQLTRPRGSTRPSSADVDLVVAEAVDAR